MKYHMSFLSGAPSTSAWSSVSFSSAKTTRRENWPHRPGRREDGMEQSLSPAMRETEYEQETNKSLTLHSSEVLLVAAA